jgi:hypothetical protein
MKTVPKYIKAKVERMSRLMEQIVELNLEVESWMEANGVEGAFDYTRDYRDDRGYGIYNVPDFIDEVERAIN